MHSYHAEFVVVSQAVFWRLGIPYEGQTAINLSKLLILFNI